MRIHRTLLAAALLGTAVPALAQDLPGDLYEYERNTIEVFRHVSPSVAYVTNYQLRRTFTLDVTAVPAGSGTGFLWDDKGHVVTNFHVVYGGQKFRVVLADQTAHDATVVGVEPNKDLAVLQINDPPAGLEPVVLGDSGNLVVGQTVLAIGNPFGLDQTLTTGIISALGREIQAQTGVTIRDVIQTDASINPGNSGGPLLDSRGRIIGVNTAIYSPSGASAGIGFAVPVNTVKQVVPQLIRFGRVKRAGLGVSLISDDLARRWGVKGEVIREVAPDSAAEKAGLHSLEADAWGRVQSYDVIVGIDEFPIQDYDDLYTALDNHKAGDTVTVFYQRNGGETQRTRLTLQELD